MIKVKVYVTLKKGVLDPQGKTIRQALEHLEFKGIEDVRIGKYIEVSLNAKSMSEAESEIKNMCEKLLANTVIEDYRFEIETGKE